MIFLRPAFWRKKGRWTMFLNTDESNFVITKNNEMIRKFSITILL